MPNNTLECELRNQMGAVCNCTHPGLQLAVMRDELNILSCSRNEPKCGQRACVARACAAPSVAAAVDAAGATLRPASTHSRRRAACEALRCMAWSPRCARTLPLMLAST